MLRTLCAYLGAVITAYATATIAHTQWVLWSLSRMGAPVGLDDRLAATGHDLVGMATSYLPIIAVGLAIAFPVAGLLARSLPRLRWLAYPLGGGVALLAIHVILYQLLAVTPIASARTMLGLTVQALCGVLGGWVFREGMRRRVR